VHGPELAVTYLRRRDSMDGTVPAAIPPPCAWLRRHSHNGRAASACPARRPGASSAWAMREPTIAQPGLVALVASERVLASCEDGRNRGRKEERVNSVSALPGSRVRHRAVFVSSPAVAAPARAGLRSEQ
jgi:hypothetical protein